MIDQASQANLWIHLTACHPPIHHRNMLMSAVDENVAQTGHQLNGSDGLQVDMKLIKNLIISPFISSSITDVQIYLHLFLTHRFKGTSNSACPQYQDEKIFKNTKKKGKKKERKTHKEFSTPFLFNSVYF